MATQNNIRSILRKVAPRGEPLRGLIERISNPQYWLDMNPAETISGLIDDSLQTSMTPDDEQFSRAIRQYKRFGYLQLDRALSSVAVQRMRRCIETLCANRWPPVFSFIYDTPWTICASVPVRRMLTEILGPRYVTLPKVSSHYVHSMSNGAGWHPHRDGDGAARTVTVWVPLSSARPVNGCVYVLEEDQATPSKIPIRSGSLSSRDISDVLHRVTALPAEPGEILCWNDRVLHWGGFYHDGAEPRVSVAMVFADADDFNTAMGPYHFELLDIPPAFDVRLRVIARAILANRSFDPSLELFLPAAEQLYGCDET